MDVYNSTKLLNIGVNTVKFQTSNRHVIAIILSSNMWE